MRGLTINRLAPRVVLTLVDHIAAGDGPLPENIRQDIVGRSDCVPLFVEEITNAVLETENEGPPPPAAASVYSTAPAVPASLHASLMARLDRLGPAKRVAQVGAAIGRRFSHALLACVAGLPEPELNSALDRFFSPDSVATRGRRRKRPISSSARRFRTRPMELCCVSLDVCCTLVSRKFWKASLPM